MDGCTAIIFCCKTCQIGFVQAGVVCAAWYHCGGLSQQNNNRCVRTALCTMTKLGWRQFWHALQKWLLSSHPWPNMNDQCTIYERKINMLSCTEISFVISLFFFNFEKFGVKPWFPFTQLNRANTQNLEKINVDMFYKDWLLSSHLLSNMRDQCIIYERKIIVLSFPVIYSFVILILVSQRFETKSGFLFFDSHCIPPQFSIYIRYIYIMVQTHFVVSH